MLLFPATVAASVIVAVILEGGTTNATLARRRIALLLTTAAYGGALAGVWPVISREDYLPFYPMLAVTVAAEVDHVAQPHRVDVVGSRGGLRMSRMPPTSKQERRSSKTTSARSIC